MLTEGEAMWQDNHHPSDQTLLSAIDDELSVTRGTAVESHLATCEPCRSRLQKMESLAAEVSRLYRDEFTRQNPGSEALRRRVQASVRDLSVAMSRSWWFRVLEELRALPGAARVGAALVMVVVVVQCLRPAPGSMHSEMVLMPVESGSLPVRSLTPGATGNVSIRALCTDHAPPRPTIPAAVRAAILHDYQMEAVPEREYELDYLITPELGGIADRRNLWPERYDSRVWNAHVKDDLERLLPRLVCQGTLDLETAQHDIAANWIGAYQKYFQTDRPIARQSSILVDDDDIEVARAGANPQSRPTSPSESRPFLVVSIATAPHRGWGAPPPLRSTRQG
jgi:hypothetical protein